MPRSRTARTQEAIGTMQTLGCENVTYALVCGVVAADMEVSQIR